MAAYTPGQISFADSIIHALEEVFSDGPASGNTRAAALKALAVAAGGGFDVSTDVAVTVPSITDPDIAKVDVTVTGVAVGDFVLAAPKEALPTNARLQGAFVTATNTVTVVFGSEGGNVTGAAVDFDFLVFDRA